MGEALYRDGAGAAAHFGFTMPVLYRVGIRRRKTGLTPLLRLDTLLREADFVCVILPLTAKRHLFGATQFARMKSSLFLLMPDAASGR